MTSCFIIALVVGLVYLALWRNNNLQQEMYKYRPEIDQSKARGHWWRRWRWIWWGFIK